MYPLVLCAVAIAASLMLLYVGAKNTLQGALWISRSLGVSRIITGCIFVAMVTALPELMSSLIAAIWQSSDLAFGNILGSNIYNIPLIIGLCGLVREFRIGNSIAEKESGFMIVLSAFLALVLILTGAVTWWLGLIFLVMYPMFVYYSIRVFNTNNGLPNNREGGATRRKAAIYLVLGGMALLSGTFLLVRSALYIVELYEVKEFYVGLTIMTLGSILPELAVSLFAALEGEHEVSIGNVIGDNIVTITLVFGLVAVIHPFETSALEVLSTMPFMILVTVMLLAMSRGHRRVTRPLSLIMLLVAVLSFIVQTLLLT